MTSTCQELGGEEIPGSGNLAGIDASPLCQRNCLNGNCQERSSTQNAVSALPQGPCLLQAGFVTSIYGFLQCSLCSSLAPVLRLPQRIRR